MRIFSVFLGLVLVGCTAGSASNAPGDVASQPGGTSTGVAVDGVPNQQPGAPGAGTATSPPPSLSRSDDPCRRVTSEAEQAATHPLDIMMAAVKRAEENDQWCGPLPPQDRQCRALAVALIGNPAAYLADPDRLVQADELTWWAATEGVRSAQDSELVAAWRRLAQTTSAIVAAPTEAAQASALQQRAVDEIVEPIRAAEERCNASS